MARSKGKIKVQYEALKELREELGLTRSIVCDEIGWTADKLIRVEEGTSGNTKNTVKYVEDLCKYYKVEDTSKYLNYDFRETKFIVFGMGKGGVTKTTSVSEITFYLQQQYNVLVIDGDPQTNLTKRMADDDIPIEKNLVDLISVDEENIPNIKITDYITETRFGSHCDMIASSVGLYSADRKLSNRYMPFAAFNHMKDEITKLGKYDYVLIDTSPYLSTYTMGLYLLTDKLYIPTTLEPDSLEAMPSYIDSLNDISKLLRVMKRDHDFKINGIFFTRVDKRSSVQKAIREDFKEFIGNKFRILEMEVPVYAGISNAHYGRMQLGEYNNKDERAKMVNNIYKKIAREVIK